jgi:hypothetical protein
MDNVNVAFARYLFTAAEDAEFFPSQLFHISSLDGPALVFCGHRRLKQVVSLICHNRRSFGAREFFPGCHAALIGGLSKGISVSLLVFLAGLFNPDLDSVI